MKIRKQLVKIKDQGFRFAVVMEHPVWSCNLGIFVFCDVNLTNFQTFLSLSSYNTRIKVLFGLVSL
jgi:hypothetical protein